MLDVYCEELFHVAFLEGVSRVSASKLKLYVYATFSATGSFQYGEVCTLCFLGYMTSWNFGTSVEGGKKGRLVEEWLFMVAVMDS